jgi:hypothetical protein
MKQVPNRFTFRRSQQRNVYDVLDTARQMASRKALRAFITVRLNSDNLNGKRNEPKRPKEALKQSGHHQKWSRRQIISLADGKIREKRVESQKLLVGFSHFPREWQSTGLRC